ncbi:dTDP-4-dehydrorhamnose reductase [Rhizobium sp. No.120]
MRLLVTGREGQVAQSMLALSSSSAEVVAVGRPMLDIRDIGSIESAISTYRPDVVVNAAAYTAVDKAESDTEAAFAVNASGAGNVALAARRAGLPVIQISTDYVFDGLSASPYAEDGQTGPQSVYGHSKLAGEMEVATANPSHVILRTAWVYSTYGNNFLKTMLRLADERSELRIVADQLGTPTYASDIAAGILVVAHRICGGRGAANCFGTFHMVAAGETSWAGFAREIFAQSTLVGGSSADVIDITTADYPTPARRPANSRLQTTRFKDNFGYELPVWQDGVRRCIREIYQAN